jgi:molybdopterin molybdotransferase
VGVAPDKRKRIRKKIKEALECDVLLVTGGVSVGKYDFVKEILEDLGVEVVFWKVNIKPGKPLVFGRSRHTLVFGLPGNPVSTGVTFLQFVRPALHAMAGRRPQRALRLRAALEHDVAKSDRKRHFLRGIVHSSGGQLHVSTTGTQSSGVMSSLSKGNCLIIVPEENTGLRAGDQVEIELL